MSFWTHWNGHYAGYIALSICHVICSYIYKLFTVMIPSQFSQQTIDSDSYRISFPYHFTGLKFGSQKHSGFALVMDRSIWRYTCINSTYICSNTIFLTLYLTNNKYIGNYNNYSLLVKSYYGLWTRRTIQNVKYYCQIFFLHCCIFILLCVKYRDTSAVINTNTIALFQCVILEYFGTAPQEIIGNHWNIQMISLPNHTYAQKSILLSPKFPVGPNDNG